MTFLTEVEATLKIRQLTQLSDEINALNVLTLNHFILGKQPLHVSLEIIKGNHVRSKVHRRAVQALILTFWRRVY